MRGLKDHTMRIRGRWIISVDEQRRWITSALGLNRSSTLAMAGDVLVEATTAEAATKAGILDLRTTTSDREASEVEGSFPEGSVNIQDPSSHRIPTQTEWVFDTRSMESPFVDCVKPRAISQGSVSAPIILLRTHHHPTEI